MSTTYISKPVMEGAEKRILVAHASFIESKMWRSEETTWAQLVQRLSTQHQHSPFDLEEAANRDQVMARGILKRKTPPFFGGALAVGSKTTKNVTCRSLVVGDIDGTHSLSDIKSRLAGHEAIVYPTMSHLATETDVDRKAYASFVGTDVVQSDLVAHYLMEKKGYPSTAVADLLSPVETMEFGPGDFVSEFSVLHGPIERYRVAVLLAKLFIVDDHGGPEAAAKVWKRANIAFFEKHGLKVDLTCAELPARFTCRLSRGMDKGRLSRIFGGKRSTSTPSSQRCGTTSRDEEEDDTRQVHAGLLSDYQEVLDALRDHAEDRDVWLKVGMALHNASGGNDEGFDIWHLWASHSSNNNTWRRREDVAQFYRP